MKGIGALHMKAVTQVVEEGWKAERLKGPEAMGRFSFQPSNLSAFQPSVPPTPDTRYTRRSE
jgi:hypothetical protein